MSAPIKPDASANAAAAIDFALTLKRSDEAQVFLAAFRAGDVAALADWSEWPSCSSEQQVGGPR